MAAYVRAAVEQERLHGPVLQHVPLQVTEDLVFQSCGTSIGEHPDRNLINVPDRKSVV